MRLILVRHGETKLNSSQRYWGRTDVELSAVGVRQAECLRQRLAAETIDAVYASDLKRATATAEIIIAPRGLSVVPCPELREIDFGQVEGLTYEEVIARHPEVARLWAERNPNPEYPGGESRDHFDQRVARFIDRLEGHSDDDTLLVVAHSGVLRTLMCLLLGVDKKFRWQIRCELASLNILETHDQGAVLMLLNDICHLE